jgi:hypothetical protein
MSPDLLRRFHAAGFTVLWYAHPGPREYTDYQPGGRSERFGPRWHAGIDTGPQGDLICVRPCLTNEEAERWLSPGGWTPDEAVDLALAKLERLALAKPERR